MRVLSIDPSFSASAWSVWENDKLYDFGVISSSKDLTIALRLKYILDNLRKIVIDCGLEGQ
jgi:Holliday junction resolvasome RuvABC endonuclease subunit